MAKISTPFTETTCPVCGIKISCGLDKSLLIVHINETHPSVSKINLVRALFRELSLSLPENINDIDYEELDEVLINMCIYKAIRKGLESLK